MDENLQGDVAVQTDIVSPVDLSHVAGPNRPLHFIWAESRSWNHRHIRFRLSLPEKRPR